MNTTSANFNILPIRRTLLSSQVLQTKIGTEVYDQTFTHLLDVRFFSLREISQTLNTFNLPQICDQLNLRKNTKFLARYVFDLALTDLIQLTESQKAKLWIVSIILAYEINEAQHHDGHEQFVQLFQSWENQHDLSPLLHEVKQMLSKKEEKLQGELTFSPYDLISCKLKSFLIPSENEYKVKKSLEAILDLAISHSNVSSYLCQDLLEASWIVFITLNAPTWLNQQQLVCQDRIGDKVAEMKSFLLEMLSEE